MFMMLLVHIHGGIAVAMLTALAAMQVCLAVHQSVARRMKSGAGKHCLVQPISPG